jgi:hypothetical protein
MALIAKQKYDPSPVQKIYELVALYHEKGEPCDYEIIVDKLKVVKRTSNPEMFYGFERFVDASTKTVEILLYSGSSNVNDRWIFSFVDEPEPNVSSANGLSGTDLQEKVKDQLAEQKQDLLKQIKHEQLEKENEELKKEVIELEADVTRLEKENEQLVNAQSPLRPFLGEIGSSLVESFLRRNPRLVKSIPGGEALAGLIEPAATDGPDELETNVSFQPKAKGHSGEEEMAITFVNQLKEQFTKPEFDQIVIILQSMANDKAIIQQIINQYK